ncbi:MAG: efflux RND transporter periplasmic adaptor subunit [Cytophagales bacterium]
MFKKVILITVLVVFVSLCLGVTGYLYYKEQKPKEVFKTDSVVVATIYKKTVATGTIEPRREVTVKPQASGIIEKLFVKAGDIVQKGDPIAKIKVVANMINLNSAESNIKTARINFERAEAEYKRRKQLFEDKVIAQADFITFEQDFLLKKEQVAAAESYMELVKYGTSKRNTTTNTIVRATIDGKILDLTVKEGSFVIESNNFNDGTTVGSIANMKDLIFKGKVVESEIGKLKEGMDLNLQVGAIGEDVFKAKLEFIASKGVEDKGSIQYEIKAGIIPSTTNNRTIRAGYSASADIIIDSKDSVLSIKEKNIEFKGDCTFVYKENGSQNFVRQQIRTGISDDITIEVVSGLNKNDKIKVLENK